MRNSRNNDNEYVFTPEDLLGSDGKPSTIKCLKVAVKLLEDEHLNNVENARPALDPICRFLKTEDPREAIAFIPVFDRYCGGSCTDLDDAARFYECSMMEIMEYVSGFDTLEKKGILLLDNIGERRAVKKRYKVNSEVLSAVVNNKHIPDLSQNIKGKIDQYQFCKEMDDIKEERSDGDITTATMFREIEALEIANPHLALVQELKSRFENIETRALFYEMCNDFISGGGNRDTDIADTLKDMYDGVRERVREQSLLVGGKHELITAGLILKTGDNDLKLSEAGVELFAGADASAFIKSYRNLDRYSFVEMMDDLRKKDITTAMMRQMGRDVEKIEKANPQLEFIGKLVKPFDAQQRLLFYCVCNESVGSGRFWLEKLNTIYPRSECGKIAHLFRSEEHPLQKEGLVQHEKAGFFQESALSLTDKGKELFFGEDARYYIEKAAGKDYIPCDKITAKRLFFADELQRQLNLLQSSLMERNFQELRAKLEEKGMPKGICVLLYGLPGTGKTESVMQIAKATGRPVLHVDISQTKSCWFGESEKLIKEVFTKYKDLCKRSDVRPILLFNEADAIFSKRKDVESGNVAQTENAIQNIILEEMESLDGILVATTNLTENLDPAFERRFLFKIRYDKPTSEAKRSIWLDKMPGLQADEAGILADTFDFSGGEIDNIVRKATMSEIIDGQPADFKGIMTLCQDEKIKAKGSARKIGF